MPQTNDSAVTLTLDTLLALRQGIMSTRELAARGLTGLPGNVQGRRRGNGLDFDDLRHYHPGDDVRHMDWNVTARTLKPHIRLYREDRERAVSVALDLRPSMFNGSQQLRAALACKLAAVTLWQASHNGDRCAVVIQDTTGIHASRPRIAERGVLEALGLISKHYQHALDSSTSATSPALSDLLAFINGAGRVAGSVLLFSGLDDCGEHYARELAIAAHHGRLTTVLVADVMESNGLPAGRYAYASANTPRSMHLSRADMLRLKHSLQRLDTETRAPFQHHHLGITRVDDFEHGKKDMLRYFNQFGLV